MADRAGGKGKPGVPKEVFELDKDERWQARLDEARARREIALREKAAGKAQKPRPKPWEIEGSAVEAPPAVEPIIQERGDDKFDFADRLETIREAKSDATPAVPKPPATAAVPPRQSEQKPVADKVVKAPQARARPQPSLILPGAPDVAELAVRYAATLEHADPLEIREPEERVEKEEVPEAELVPLHRSLPRSDAPPVDDVSSNRRHRRRGIRPLGMAFGLLALAAVPFGTEAPPLETGPAMPQVDVLGIQPALGVTWSLYEVPVQTRSGEWVPMPPPRPFATIPVTRSINPLNTVALPPLPPVGSASSVEWSGVTPVSAGVLPGLIPPDLLVDDVPAVAPAPTRPEPPVASGEGPAVPVLDGQVSAPPRPATLVDEEEIVPAAPPEPPAPRPRAEDVVEANPLRVTILAPARADRALAQDIASQVEIDGHELVRVRDVDFAISERNVRYFHEADREAAARMAERYDAELRDFTWFQPKPVGGTAELWLAGRSAGENTSGRVPPVPAPAPAPVAEQSTAGRSDFLGRVFDRLGLGTELPDALPDELRSVLPGDQ